MNFIIMIALLLCTLSVFACDTVTAQCGEPEAEAIAQADYQSCIQIWGPSDRHHFAVCLADELSALPLPLEEIKPFMAQGMKNFDQQAKRSHRGSDNAAELMKGY